MKERTSQRDSERIRRWRNFKLRVCRRPRGSDSARESDDHPYRMKIYNLKGKQLADENLDFYYQNLQIEEKQILLTNRQELCVYT